MNRRTFLAALGASGIVQAADAANMSGHWVINTKESRWGRKKAPQNLTLDIQHDEPKLKYTGEITQDLEGQPSRFTFDGAIDGKEYPVTQDGAQRKAVFKRDGKYSVTSTFTSMDGKSVEEGRTSISMDGKKLTRRVTLKAPEGTASWTEIYDKQ